MNLKKKIQREILKTKRRDITYGDLIKIKPVEEGFFGFDCHRIDRTLDKLDCNFKFRLEVGKCIFRNDTLKVFLQKKGFKYLFHFTMVYFKMFFPQPSKMNKFTFKVKERVFDRFSQMTKRMENKGNEGLLQREDLNITSPADLKINNCEIPFDFRDVVKQLYLETCKPKEAKLEIKCIRAPHGSIWIGKRPIQKCSPQIKHVFNEGVLFKPPYNDMKGAMLQILYGCPQKSIFALKKPLIAGVEKINPVGGLDV